MAVLETLPLTTIGVVIIIAIALGILAKRLGQNPVLGFIVAGFFLGPFWLGFLHPQDPLVRGFAEMGLFIVLFYLGLELSIKDFLEAGKATLGMAVINILALLAAGTGISLLFGFSLAFSILVGFMLFATSTAIVAKFAIDKKIINDQNVKLSVSTLILQDFLGILLVVFITSNAGNVGVVSLSARAIVFAVATFYVVYQLSRKVEGWLETHGFGHTETTLYALGIGLVIATLANVLYLSTAIGAYFAGFALAATRAGTKVRRDINFMRDFFLVFFFVGFGTTLFFDVGKNAIIIPPIESIALLVAMALLLTAGIVAINSLVFALFGPLFGLSRKDSSLSAILLVPLGEFVVIIAVAGQTILSGNEAAIIPTMAFLLILFTVLVFQPLYSRLPAHQAIMARFPHLFSLRNTAKPAQRDSQSVRLIKHIGMNAFAVVSMAWMALLLFEALPSLGVPIPASRELTTMGVFAFFATYPVFQMVKAFRQLVTWKNNNKNKK